MVTAKEEQFKLEIPTNNEEHHETYNFIKTLVYSFIKVICC